MNTEIFSPDDHIFMEFLKQELELDPESAAKVLQCFSYKEIKKGQQLFADQKTQDSVCFLSEGYVRIYYCDEKKAEHTFEFCFAGSLAASPAYYLSAEISEFQIIAMKPVKVFMLNSGALEKIPASSVLLRKIELYLLRNSLRKSSAHAYVLSQSDAEAAYKKVLEINPKFAAVPIKYLASYIGIHANSLTRIRRKISGKL